MMTESTACICTKNIQLNAGRCKVQRKAPGPYFSGFLSNTNQHSSRCVSRLCATCRVLRCGMVGLSSKISWGSGRCTVMMLFSVAPAFSKLLHYIEPPGQSQYVKQSNSDTCFVFVCVPTCVGEPSIVKRSGKQPTESPPRTLGAHKSRFASAKRGSKEYFQNRPVVPKIARGGGFDLLRQDV